MRAADPVSVETILAAYARATHARGIVNVETSGTLAGEGLTGTFQSWRAGDDERDDQQLGLRTETTLRRNDRTWVRNANGNVRELDGVLLRHVATDAFIDSGAFLDAPERARYAGSAAVAGEPAWRLAVTAPGGDPVTLWIDATSGLPLREAYVEGDGVTTVDFGDWHDVSGRRLPFRAVTSDGEHAFDIVAQTTNARLDVPIAPAVFAPLAGRVLTAPGVQTVPLVAMLGHLACTVAVAGHNYTFLLDTGAQNVLLDTRLAQRLGLREEGSLEVSGATRHGGLRVARLPRLRIGDAELDDLVVSTLDLHAQLGGLHVDGILGYPFFAAALVELDRRAGTMRFGPPGSFAPAGERIPLDVDREIPEAMLRLDDRLDAPFLVDTGNSSALFIYRPFAARHPELIPASGQAATTAGVGGLAPSFRTRLGAIALGSFPLAPDVEVILAKSGAFADRVDAGNLGLGALDGYVLTFDLNGRALYVRKQTSATSS